MQLTKCLDEADHLHHMSFSCLALSLLSGLTSAALPVFDFFSARMSCGVALSKEMSNIWLNCGEETPS